MKGPVVVFSGHRIDDPGRAEERFPARIEAAVRTELEEVIGGLSNAYGDLGLGIAAIASGGDILFHEIMRAAGAETIVYLPLPFEDFVDVSVAPAGPDWVGRASALVDGADTVALPRAGTTDLAFEAANIQMIDDARSLAGPDGALLMVLWDGQPSDQPGGTAQMIDLAEQHDLPIVIVDLARILHFPGGE